MVALLPFAATNLRARFTGRISATDASDHAEAGVSAFVPHKMTEELSRHCLRKSVWTKLLPPGKAWERARGILDPELELPGEDESFKSNPLWETLARCLSYRTVFVQKVKARRHINIGELRGFLKLNFARV